MFILKNNTLSELVSDDYRLASVFKEYGIDYYCRGERTIQEVCESKNIKSKLLVHDLENAVIATNEDIFIPGRLLSWLPILRIKLIPMLKLGHQ